MGKLKRFSRRALSTLGDYLTLRELGKAVWRLVTDPEKAVRWGVVLTLAYSAIMMFWEEWFQQPWYVKTLSGAGVALLADAAVLWGIRKIRDLSTNELEVRVYVGGLSMKPPSKWTAPPARDLFGEMWNIDIAPVRISNPHADRRLELSFKLHVDTTEGPKEFSTEPFRESEQPEIGPNLTYFRVPVTVEPQTTVPKQGFKTIGFLVRPGDSRFTVEGAELRDFENAELEIIDLNTGERVRKGIFGFLYFE